MVVPLSKKDVGLQMPIRSQCCAAQQDDGMVDGGVKGVEESPRRHEETSRGGKARVPGPSARLDHFEIRVS